MDTKPADLYQWLLKLDQRPETRSSNLKSWLKWLLETIVLLVCTNQITLPVTPHLDTLVRLNSLSLWNDACVVSSKVA